MTDPDVLDLRGVADALGRDYHTVRKAWRAWADPKHPDYRHFPMPFDAPPPGRRGAIRWRASAIDEWKLARERALGAGHSCPDRPSRGRPSAPLAAPVNKSLQRQRAAMAHLMERP